MLQSGVYAIINIVTDKCYIGSSANTAKRWREHKNQLKKGIHHSDYLQRSYNVHGEPAFLYEIIEKVELPELLFRREQFYVDWLKPEYNMYPVVDSPRGYKHSEETRRNFSKIQKERPRSEKERQQARELRQKYASSAEVVHRRTLSLKETYQRRRELYGGKAFSEEHCQNLSLAKKDDPRMLQHLRELAEGQKGVPLSEERRCRQSERVKNNLANTEHLHRLSEKNRGKIPTEGQREKSSKSMKEWWVRKREQER